MVEPRSTNGPSHHLPADVHASILLDMAQVAQVAPKMLPESFGPDNRYRLEELIGIGRDSHVYKAIDHHLSKPSTPAYVAVKIRASSGSTRVEALVGRSVLHDNVVRVIDHGISDDDEPYMVQEWISGGDLDDLALPLESREAAKLVQSISRGIQALHSAGNIHGDLKPANVLMTPDGTPKITDFDLASATDLDEYRRGGNLAFMAPELLLEDDLLPSPLGDVYALGGMLYFFLTGALPHGNDSKEIVNRHRDRRNPDMTGIERDLARICARALAQSPDRRYRSAEALADDLELWLGRQPILWTNPSLARRTKLVLRRRPVPIVIGALLVIVGLAVAAMVQMAATRKIDAERQAIELSKAELEVLNERAREMIRGFVESGVFQTRMQRGPSVFAALAWVDWFADFSVLGDDGPQIAAQERLESLSDLRHSLKTSRRAGTHLDGLAAFCMAYSAIELGDYALAIEQVGDAERSVLRLFPETDEMAVSLRGLRLVAEYHLAAEAGAAELGSLRPALEELETDLRRVENPHSIATLIRSALDKHLLDH